MTVFIAVFITSILLIANSFLYRYLQVCKHHLFEHIMAPRNLSVVILVNAAIFANWFLVTYVVYWPNDQFTANISQMAKEFTELDAFKCAQIGFSV
ncbi:hypothetical protein COOONC_14392, partial [Cooperia oncophora]